MPPTPASPPTDSPPDSPPDIDTPMVGGARVPLDIDATMRRVVDAIEHMTWSNVATSADVPAGMDAFDGRWASPPGWAAYVAAYPSGVEDGRRYAAGVTGAVTCFKEALVVKLPPEVAQRAVSLARTALAKMPHDENE